MGDKQIGHFFLVSPVTHRVASLACGVMMRGSGTGTLRRLLPQNSVPLVTGLASGHYSWRFLVVKPSRGSEILVFGPFCNVICREDRKI